ncbi:hypothetical protein SCOR_26705 [Sulfidibacter corallicola]|uniref:Multicopper oxidase n=1 Tax=Sulfidibacter corallicola TaxID=2818388 RepID=A0A8A4TWF6_SULCO|nr:hypothetical protein [Sulfidibacter corallicola]QTD50855.1 hypothetical protein J3U87_00170 [Sulfidibacter corallicola]
MKVQVGILLASLCCGLFVFGQNGAEVPSCTCTVIADVVALDQPWQANRLGAAMTGGKVFALRTDVVPTDHPVDDFGNDIALESPPELTAGQVRLNNRKRPRPIVLRVSEGECLEIRFQNLLASDHASVYVAGLSLVPVEGQPGIASGATYVGANPTSEAVPGPGGSAVYKYYAAKEGMYFLYTGPSGPNATLIQEGLFGSVNVQPPGAEYYRSQVRRTDLEAAAMTPKRLPASATLHAKGSGQVFAADAGPGQYSLAYTDAEGKERTQEVRIDARGHMRSMEGHPLIDYQAAYPDGTPVLRMTRPVDEQGNKELVYSDLTAIITGPNGGRFPFYIQSPVFFENPASPDRRQPYREFTIIYHFALGLTQSFPVFSYPDLSGAFGAVADTFGINYGLAGIGAEIIANRLGVGPEGFHGDEVDLKFEEFFLSSWAVGDPAMIVDVPANAPNQVVRDPAQGQQLEQVPLFQTSADSATLDDLNDGKLSAALAAAFAAYGITLTSPEVVVGTKSDDQTAGVWAVTDPNPEDQAPPASRIRYPIGQIEAGGSELQVYIGMPDNITAVAIFNQEAKERATKAFYPDDPSNVYHSYLRDHVKFRVANATSVAHVHHLHAHQWLKSPNSDDSHYLDSQLITEGTTFTMEIAYNGSGNRNQTVGDSIFHCHFYPHFAAGMWSLWRVHDVFEAGTILEPDGVAATHDAEGNVLWNRALPDGEIAAGTPIPAIVPLPTLGMAPIPAPVRLSNAEDPTIDGLDLVGRRAIVQPLLDEAGNPVMDGDEPVYENPGYPFFNPSVAGHRPVHPPMDYAWAEDENGEPLRDENGDIVYLDGGLPRHQVLDGEVVRNLFTRWDFSKDFILFDTERKRDQNQETYLAGNLVAYEVPERGTAVEKAAMRFHAQRTHPTLQPNGQAGNFTVNGLPPRPGAPYADPAVDNDGNSVSNLKRYKAANIQLDVVLNKKGWHYPQQRILALWYDVKPTISGERPPEPFFFRSHTGDTIEYWHTNLVPNYYDMDDFQVRTPTDVLGQHIHLVKFDVTSSDGAANGFNYEDGTFSPDEVRERIIALNNNGKGAEGQGGIYLFDNATQFAANVTRNLAIKDYRTFYPFFGEPPPYQNWDGAQTTIQTWDTDPLLNDLGEDRTLRTVFTHDHFSPSTHQQIGFYAGMVVEPEGSNWFTNAPTWSAELTAPFEAVELPPYTEMFTRPDGGPTSWQAIIREANAPDAYREFMLEFQDIQLAYTAGSDFRKHRPDQLSPSVPLFGLTVPAGDTLEPVDAQNFPYWLREAFQLEGIPLSNEAFVTATPPPDCGTCGDIAGASLTVVDTTTDSGSGECAIDLYPIVTESGEHQVFSPCIGSGWGDPAYAINAPNNTTGNTQSPSPSVISGFPPNGTYSVNYRSEPIPLRVDTNIDPAVAATEDVDAVDLGLAFTSIERMDPDLNRQPLGALINPDDAPFVTGNPEEPQPFTFPKNPLNFNVSPYDPYTPLMNAYQGDRIQVRTLVGAHIDPHSFQIHGVKWFFEPSYTNSGYRSLQGMGLSEHFEMLFAFPFSETQGRGFSDLLYQPDASDNGLLNGHLGLMRGYTVPPAESALADALNPAELPHLPDNPDPAAAAEPMLARWQEVVNTFDNPSVDLKSGALPRNYKTFHVIATTAAQVLRDVSDGRIVVNARGQVTANSSLGGDSVVVEPGTELVNPYGLIYVLAEDLAGMDAASVLRGDLSVTPLVFRVNAGDWIRVKLTNHFYQRELFRFPTDAGIVAELNDTQVSQTLQDIFAVEGIALADSASVVVCGCAWQITGTTSDGCDDPDADGNCSVTFSVQRKAGSMFVYDAAEALAWVEGAGTPYNGLVGGNTGSNDCTQTTTVGPVCLTTTTNVGLNPQLVSQQITESNGFNLGFNPVETAVDAGQTVTYYWYAGNLDVDGAGQVVETPVELGAVNLRAADYLVAYRNNLYAAMIVQPEHSVWVEDAGNRAYATVFERGSDSSFDVRLDRRGRFLFREMVAITIENQNAWSAATLTDLNPATNPPFSPLFPLNYKAEPASERDTQGTSDFAWMSNSVVLTDPDDIFSGDPETPVFHTSAGAPTRIRYLFAGGGVLNGPQLVVMLDGHSWQEEPFIDDSTRIGDNIRSQEMGSQQILPHEPFNFILPSAGGPFAVPGDYALHTFICTGDGNWGLMRVSERLVLIDRALDYYGRLQLSGLVLEGADVAGGVPVHLTLTDGETGETVALGTVATRADGSWWYRSLRAVPSGSTVCAALDDGRCGTPDGRAATAKIDVRADEAESAKRAPNRSAVDTGSGVSAGGGER